MTGKNEKGFTLAEVIIAMGVMSVMSLGLMHMTKNMHRGQATAETKMEELELRRVISTILTDKVACQNTLAGKNIGNPITQIKNSSGTVMYAQGNIYGNNTLKISSITTQDQAQTFSDGTRSVNLVISLQKMKNIVAQTIKNANIVLRVKAASSTSTITECFADSDAIIQQSCTSSGGTWTGSSCAFPQYVLKGGDTMTGGLTAPSFTGPLTGNVTGNISGTTGVFSSTATALQFCTGGNCKAISDLALSNQTCPNGQVSFGIKSDGTINCKALQCPTNQFFAGLDSSNNVICRPYPTNTCPTNQYVSQVNSDGTVQCSIIPNTATSTCPAGQVLQSINAGVPTCVDKGAGASCPSGQVTTGVQSDGTIICGKPRLSVRTVSSSQGSSTDWSHYSTTSCCAPGEVISGVIVSYQAAACRPDGSCFFIIPMTGVINYSGNCASAYGNTDPNNLLQMQGSRPFSYYTQLQIQCLSIN